MPILILFVNNRRVDHSSGCIKKSNPRLYHLLITRSFYLHYIIISNQKLTSFSIKDPSLLRAASCMSRLIFYMQALPQHWWRLQIGYCLSKLPLQQATTAIPTRGRSQVSLDFIKLIFNMVESKDAVEKKYWWPKKSTMINAKSENKRASRSRELDKSSNSLYPWVVNRCKDRWGWKPCVGLTRALFRAFDNFLHRYVQPFLCHHAHCHQS